MAVRRIRRPTRSEPKAGDVGDVDSWSPYRAWPTTLRTVPGAAGGALTEVESTLPLAVGDTIAGAPVWWIPVA